jgi:hypothetical protein
MTLIAYRLVKVHGESENADFVQSFHKHMEALYIARNNQGQM